MGSWAEPLDGFTERCLSTSCIIFLVTDSSVAALVHRTCRAVSECDRHRPTNPTMLFADDQFPWSPGQARTMVCRSRPAGWRRGSARHASPPQYPTCAHRPQSHRFPPSVQYLATQSYRSSTIIHSRCMHVRRGRQHHGQQLSEDMDQRVRALHHLRCHGHPEVRD